MTIYKLTGVVSDNSSIHKLLDMLVKHGTLPNVPVPELITNAQTELADYELRLDLLAKSATWEHAENARLRDEIVTMQTEVAALRIYQHVTLPHLQRIEAAARPLAELAKHGTDLTWIRAEMSDILKLAAAFNESEMS